jgi:hypothetical protein
MQEKQTKYSPTGEKPQVLNFSQGGFVVRSYTIALKSLATRDPCKDRFFSRFRGITAVNTAVEFSPKSGEEPIILGLAVTVLIKCPAGGRHV